MVQVRVQPLYSMASSIAHDFFRQEANTLHLLCVLIIKGVTSLGPHIRPVCNQAPLEIFIKKVDFDLNTVCFSWTSGDARGPGLCSHECVGPGEYFGGLRMCLRSHSRDCAGQNHWIELRMRPTATQLGVFL